jgi:hypothetical protein
MAAPGETRNGIACGIAEMFAATEDDGRVLFFDAGSGDPAASAQVWLGANHWRDIEVTTDHSGRVSQIVAVRPGTFILDTIVH